MFLGEYEETTNNDEKIIEDCDSDNVEENLNNNENVSDIDDIEEIRDVNGYENKALEIAEIRVWAVTYNIPLKYIDIKYILRKRLLPQLLKNGKTFSETSKASCSIRSMYAANNTVKEFTWELRECSGLKMSKN